MYLSTLHHVPVRRTTTNNILARTTPQHDFFLCSYALPSTFVPLTNIWFYFIYSATIFTSSFHAFLIALFKPGIPSKCRMYRPLRISFISQNLRISYFSSTSLALDTILAYLFEKQNCFFVLWKSYFSFHSDLHSNHPITKFVAGSISCHIFLRYTSTAVAAFFHNIFDIVPIPNVTTTGPTCILSTSAISSMSFLLFVQNLVSLLCLKRLSISQRWKQTVFAGLTNSY